MVILKLNCQLSFGSVFFQTLDAFGAKLFALIFLKVGLEKARGGGNTVFPAFTGDTAAVLLRMTKSSAFSTILTNVCHRSDIDLLHCVL